ncbi:MAG: polysaccharide deacetylase family protein [Ignavibacteriales bacterium]|nr:polysaccharide deacetylase family protein [Ignavibacteriales bacterium]
MKINVGIIGLKTYSWKLILEQVGVPFSIAEDKISIEEFSCLIVTDEFHEKDITRLRSYLSQGGSLICSAKLFSRLTGQNCTKRYVKYILGEKDAPFFKSGFADIEAECLIPQNANRFKTNSGKASVYVGEYGGGHVVVLPFDPETVHTGWKSVRKSFYSVEKRLPHERVSLTAKGEIFRLASGALEYLHICRNIPYIHKWYLPKNFPSVFNWRIDTDGSSLNDVEKLYDVLKENNIPATWFVDGKSQESHLSIFRRMEDQEIGLHAYEHKIFDDFDDIIADMNRGKELFLVNGMNCQSFAAPYGRWDKSIAKAINESDFVYSSEFSYDYDNLPSYPVGNGESFTLQIPVHPICIGSLKRQGFSEKSMIDYFINIVNKKFNNHEPIFLYHHPRDNNAPVVRSIFNMIKQIGVPRLQLIDYGRWWKRRNSVQFKADIVDGTVLINADQFQDDVWIRILFPDGTESLVAMNKIIQLHAIRKTEKFSDHDIIDDIERIRRFNPRICLNKIEDYISSLLKPMS